LCFKYLGGSHGMLRRVRYMKGKVRARGDSTITTCRARHRPRRNRLNRRSSPPSSGNANCSVLTQRTRGRRRVCCCFRLSLASSAVKMHRCRLSILRSEWPIGVCGSCKGHDLPKSCMAL
jgi:hypothetical protein